MDTPVAKEALEIAQHLVDSTDVDLHLANEKMQEWLTTVVLEALEEDARKGGDTSGESFLESKTERIVDEMAMALCEKGYSNNADTCYDRAWFTVDVAMVHSDEIVDNAYDRLADAAEQSASPSRYHGVSDNDF